MSVDYFLYSPSKNRCVMVGSVGMSGVKSWPQAYGGGEFIAWAIENNVDDVCLVNENQLPDEVENLSKYRKAE